jgi:putative hydrolase of the HAD superfamily
VVFDAVGTLIEPVPSPSLVYERVGRRWGSQRDSAAITRRFRDAFEAEEAVDRLDGNRTSEAREKERWRRIVYAVLDDLTEPERCFIELFEHFQRPLAWRARADAGLSLATLRERGLAVGIASNFDARLRTVLAGIPVLASITSLCISSEVGWKKPARQFYEALTVIIGLPPGEILHVGDNRAHDYEAAHAAGLRAVLLDPDSHEVGPQQISQLAELLTDD